MMQQIFTVYDDKAKAYLPPFFMPEQTAAKRVFGDCVNSKDHQFARHPADYTLFCLGYYDDSTGKLSELDAAENLGNGVIYIELLPQFDHPEDPTREATNSDGTPIQSGSLG